MHPTGWIKHPSYTFHVPFPRISQRFPASQVDVGAAEFHRDWNIVEQRATTGPISLFLICFNEFVATLLSFGNEKLKAPVYLMTCLVTFPIRHFDALFVGRKSFIGLAPIILTVFRKP